MPSTYTLISSNVLSTSAASVTFSAIPSTYTDLVLRYSARLDGGAGSGVGVISLNSAALSMSTTYLFTNFAGSASSGRDSAATSCGIGYINDGGSTPSNTFTNAEIYIPNYAVSGVNKQMSTITAMEYESSAFNYGYVGAINVTSTAAITSINIDNVTGGSNFVAGSSFYLYGIKNS